MAATRLFGALGEFENPAALYQACENMTVSVRLTW